MNFWLGTHRPNWLSYPDVAVPLMVSHRTLDGRRSLPRAVAPWVCDSGAFTEVRDRGADAFAAGPEPYAESLLRYHNEVRQLAWAAPQDWMCEPFMVARTGLSVAEHQRRTVAGYVALRALVPGVRMVPVLQGHEPGEYLRCAELYAIAGVDLSAEPVVGLGSVCRRQHTGGLAGMVMDFAADGIRLHAFGVKTTGLPYLAPYLSSSDSLAWSYDARRVAQKRGGVPLAGCTHGTCANCPRYALAWRARLLRQLDRQQPALFGRTV